METSGQDEGGRYGKGVEVRFQTGGGLVGSVFVPNSQYRPDMVKTLVAARVALMEQTHKLSG